MVPVVPAAGRLQAQRFHRPFVLKPRRRTELLQRPIVPLGDGLAAGDEGGEFAQLAQGQGGLDIRELAVEAQRKIVFLVIFPEIPDPFDEPPVPGDD